MDHFDGSCDGYAWKNKQCAAGFEKSKEDSDIGTGNVACSSAVGSSSVESVSGRSVKKKKRYVHLSSLQDQNPVAAQPCHRQKSNRLRAIESMAENECGSELCMLADDRGSPIQRQHVVAPTNARQQNCRSSRQKHIQGTGNVAGSSVVGSLSTGSVGGTPVRKKKRYVQLTCLQDGSPGPAQPCHRRKSNRLRVIESMPENDGNDSSRQQSCRKSRHKPIKGVPRAATTQPLPADRLVLPAPTYCSKCRAKKFTNESKHFCCADGEIVLAVNEFPAELIDLFVREDELREHFRQYSRMYNNLFAFSSLGGSIDAGSHKGIYVFKLHGQIYHFVPELLPEEGKPRYLQLYFYDGEFEAMNRTKAFPQVKEAVIDILMKVTTVNPYARFFRSLQEVHVDEHTQIMLSQNPCLDQRVYNMPSSDEVAVIWPESMSSSDCSTPHILIRASAGETHRIYHHYGCCDPLQYPLLFPYGECGWRQGIRKNTLGSSHPMADSVDPINSCAVHSVNEFLDEEHRRATKHRTRADKFISPRDLSWTCMYVKTENTRLDFLRNNQDTIRADLYQGILDSYQDGERSAKNVGHRIILPPSFLGGPRDLKRRYLNAMALVQKYGKPDFFITMTCNANWPKIQCELLNTQTARDRPEVVVRIFRAKLLALKNKIMKEHVLGEVAAMIYVVEFQKRGLPHAHFLVILKPNFKIKEPAHYDKFVSAEISHIDNILFRKSVVAHMMHGPCGHLRPDCPCMRTINGKRSCKNNYPKAFISETTTNNDGYPLYKRRPTGEKVRIRGSNLDNRWVVPYNPYLLLLFDYHLNVEVCSTIKDVKYLYKYVYKGHDRVQFVVGSSNCETINEIDEYQSGRWVSPCEAVWRLFGFDPLVLPLPIHLPNSQNIQMREHERLHSVIQDSKRACTALTEFFAFNARNPTKRKYLYNEFTEHYRWDPSTKEWIKRKNKRICIGRPTFVLPAEEEHFFLRLLILNVRAPTSFTHLRIVDGHVCSTFQEAALELRLLEDDNAADKCLSEAFEVQLPAALRRLFAVVLIFCHASDPLSLWEKHYSSLCEDYVRLHPGDPGKARQLIVAAVEEHLQAMGKSLKAFGLEELQHATTYEFTVTKDIVDALNEIIPPEFMYYKDMLNERQEDAFSTIMGCVVQKKPGAFFIYGPRGTGKTFLYNALFAEVRSMKKIVLPTATSGIAAANLPNGSTAHSRFKIPVDSERSLACDVPKQGSLAALIKETSLIIWDEASMANKSNIESLNLLLQDICGNTDFFGGKLVVYGGDFRQVLPVVPRKTQKEVVAASIVSSHLWTQLKKIHLTENQRAREDPMYSGFLLSLGDGNLQEAEHDYVSLPETIVQHIIEDVDPISQLIEYTFPEIAHGNLTAAVFSTKTIMSPLNLDVDLINSHVIEHFPGEQVVYKSFDVILSDTYNVYPIEFINTLCPGGMSPHELLLKPGCPVMLIRNLLPSAGLCNGTRLVCEKFFPNIIECVISVGQHMGEHVFIPRINLRPSKSDKYPFEFERKQFPLKLSFAMTINKAQGQTLDQVSVYLAKPCFAHGQLYVALSRAKFAAKITVFCMPPPPEQHKFSVKNVVSYGVLELAGIR